MPFLQTYTIANSLAANEIWTRTNAEKGLSNYVNDTLRATGVKRTLDLKGRRVPKTNKSTTPSTVTNMVEWTEKATAFIAGHAEPVEISRTYRIPDSLANLPGTYRPVFKDLNLALTTFTDSDSELDDVADARTQ